MTMTPDQRAPVGREVKSSTVKQSLTVPETVTSAAYLAIYGEGMDPFQHPEGWEYAESIASAILSALPASAPAPDVSEERAREVLADHLPELLASSARVIRDNGWRAGITMEEVLIDAGSAIRAMRAFAAQAATVGEGDAVERLAQWLHDEGGFDEAWQATWPEHADDTGQRDGGFVRLVPSDVQAKFREVATRLLKRFPQAALPLPATQPEQGVGEDEETYQIGVRDGFESAVQEIDLKTGGDGEYRYCTNKDPERHTPDAPAMIQRIVDRFEALSPAVDGEEGK